MLLQLHFLYLASTDTSTHNSSLVIFAQWTKVACFYDIKILELYGAEVVVYFLLLGTSHLCGRMITLTV